MKIPYKRGNILIRPSIFSDVETISNRMRSDDVREIWAASRTEPYVALEKGFSLSQECLTAEFKGEPVAMFGVYASDAMSGKANIWLLGTPELEKIWVCFGRLTKRVIQYFLKRYQMLYNFVDLRNKKSISWLRWAGASMGEPAPHGPFNMPFILFKFQRA